MKGQRYAICYLPTLNLGPIYWRIENYAQTIAKEYDTKYALHVEPFFDPFKEIPWSKICLDATEYARQIQSTLEGAFQFFDVLIIQKLQNKEGLALVKMYHEQYPTTKIFMECDDSIGDVTPSNRNVAEFREHNTIAAEHASISDGVICSCRYLADSMLKFNLNVHVAPNCISPHTWKIDKKKKKLKGRTNIVYVGGGGHDEDFKTIYSRLRLYVTTHKDIYFTWYSGGYLPDWFKADKRFQFVQVAWHILKYPQSLYNTEADIALAPLRDTEFNRCKSNLKWIEWSSIDVPLLASNVVPYRNTAGKIWLYDRPEFIDKLRELVDSYHLVREGLLSKDCFKNYNIKKETDKLLSFILFDVETPIKVST